MTSNKLPCNKPLNGLCKKVILTLVLLAGALQADNVVHYDIRETKKPAISKPNHPSTDLYTKS